MSKNFLRSFDIVAFSVLLVLIIGQFALGHFMMQQQESELTKSIHTQTEHELHLLTHVAYEALQSNDYQVIPAFLKKWGRENSDIIELRLLSATGFPLGEYKRQESGGDNTFSMSEEITYSFRGKANLTIIKDMSAVDSQLARLRLFIATSLFITIIIWFLVRILIKRRLQSTLIVEHAAEIKEANEFLNSVIESIPTPFLVIDVNTHEVVKANSIAGHENWHGMTCNAIWKERGLPCDDIERCPLEEVKKTGKPAMTLQKFTHDDGQELNLEVHGYPIFNDQGEVVLMIESTVDVTERTKNEQALKESEFRYRTLFENAADAMFTMMEDTFLDCNTKTLEMFGCTRDDIVGKTPYRFSPGFQPDGRTSRGKALEKIQAALEGETQLFEWRHCQLDGTEFDAEVTLSRVEIGGKTGLLAGVRNISHRKEAEGEQMRVRNLESLGDLAGGIAHDFNNLLTAILAAFDMVQHQLEDDPNLRSVFGLAQEAINRSQDLAGKLLTFSSGGAPIRKQTDISDILKLGCDQIVKGENLHCQCNMATNLNTVEVDRRQILQVIRNLVRNSVEAMPDGGNIRIFAENVTIDSKSNLPIAPGEYVKVEVMDTGKGIIKEKLAKVFDPYFSTKDMGSQKGMGLGLSLCHSIITRHGGHINLTPADKGTTVTFHLPATVDTESLQKNIQQAGIEKRLHKQKILFMDDDEMLRQTSAILIEKLGYDVELVKNGEEALEKFQEAQAANAPFTAVILDLAIDRGMGGQETISRLRRLNPDIKAIVCSGYSEDPVMADYEEYGFSASLPKPFTPDDLRIVLEQLFST